jgi:tRNA (guanine-N7-)-methyltransferase
MPHFVANKLEKIQFPIVEDNFIFENIYHSNQESLISVKYKNKNFLLRQFNRDNNILVKSDAFTRIAPVSIIKNAIKSYAKVTNAEVIFENLTDNKSKKRDDKYKDIEFFLNEFDFNKKIFIEIGFGSGRHLLAQAKANPDVTIIGLEIHTPSIEKVLGQIQSEKLDNILILNYDARLFLELVKSNSISRVFVHFPVPWDKKEHRRVYSIEFIQQAQRVLNINGTLELRTDSINYYEYVINLFNTLDYKVNIQKNQNTIISSKYEDRWKKQQKDIYDIIFKNITLSNEISLDYDFSFGKLKDFEEIKKISKKPMIFDGFVIHFQDFFQNEKIGLIKLSFGDFNKIEHKYILIDSCTCKYYQDLPVPATKLKLAHKELKKLLK